MADDGAKCAGVERLRPAGHLDVSEPVHGEGRLVGLRPVASEDVGVSREGVPQRSYTELAVLEDFGVAERDFGTGVAVDREPDSTGNVLPEVDDRASRWRGDYVGDPELLDAADGRRSLWNQAVGDGCEFDHLSPCRVVEARRCPVGFGETRIEAFAIVEAGRQDRSVCSAPLDVGADRDHAIGVAEHELCDRADVGSVDLAYATAEAEATAIPAFGDGDTDAVPPLTDRIADVDALVAETFLIARPTRRKNMVVHRSAVEFGDVDAERCDVQFGADESGFDAELSAEADWALRGPGQVRCDGCCCEVGDRVRGAHPLIAPAVSPATILRLKNMNMISGGMVMSRTSMNSRFHWVLNWPRKL